MAYNSSCYFNCSEPPDHLSPYPDITGIGVLIGYTATAGIVVLILVFHYHLAHDPTKDPFRKDDDIGTTASRNPRPNPIDVLYLRLSSKVAAWLRFSPKLPKAKTYPRLEEVFTKCVQSMSDLQIVTGISILISGYVQLRCGLSVFHWQIIVLLAWFSSVTHLSCPTFLRNHLYNRPTERGWRLVTMGLMLSMLLVAMVPTGGYNWSDTSLPPAPYDHAVCYLRPNFYYTTVQAPTNDVAMTFWTMVISIVLLTLGFIYRIIRLHRSLSVSVVGRARTACSKKARCFLRLVYTKTNMETSGLTFKRTFLYRPLLALFLTARAILDLWNSMFVEILWMVGSFSWGLIRLLRAIQVEDRGSSDWSFGQVVPLVLLAAPLLTIFETFFKAQKPANTLSTAIAQFHTGYSQLDDDKVSSNTPLQARDHPDYDFYRDSSWTHKLIYFMVAYAFGVTATILTFGGVANSALLRFFIPSGAIIISYLPIYLVLTIWMFIMISILLEDISCAQGNVLRSFMGIKRKRLIQGFETMFFCYSLSCTIFNFLSFVGEDTLLMFLGASTVTYCMLSIMVSCVRRQHGNVF